MKEGKFDSHLLVRGSRWRSQSGARRDSGSMVFSSLAMGHWLRLLLGVVCGRIRSSLLESIKLVLKFTNSTNVRFCAKKTWKLTRKIFWSSGKVKKKVGNSRHNWGGGGWVTPIPYLFVLYYVKEWVKWCFLNVRFCVLLEVKKTLKN